MNPSGSKGLNVALWVGQVLGPLRAELTTERRIGADPRAARRVSLRQAALLHVPAGWLMLSAMHLSRRHLLLAAAGSGLALAIPRIARAAPPDAALLAKLALHAANFETMKTHTSFLIAGRVVEVDGSGNATKPREMTAQVTADGAKLHFSVLRFIDDGKDRTAEAQAQAKAKDAAPKDANAPAPAKKRDFRMPFHVGEQPRYTFDQVAVDPTNAGRVQIAFVPKIREEDTVEGTAWVDTTSGTVLSTGFKLTRPPTGMDYVHAQITFGANTSLGPSISKIDMEAEGGILWVRKHLRGSATLTNHVIVP
jgi:hypothetical protein